MTVIIELLYVAGSFTPEPQLEIVSTATVKTPVINCFIIVVIFYGLRVFLFINVPYPLFRLLILPASLQ
ncbi:hypothetical protein D3C80_714170 [compost metagenome]